MTVSVWPFFIGKRQGWRRCADPALSVGNPIRGILQPNLLANIHKSYILSLLLEFLFRCERGFVAP